MGKVIGIDLGTTMSVMAVIDEVGRPRVIHNSEGHNLTPSAVRIRGDERIVGEKARRSAKLYPNGVAQFVKRHMNEPDYTFIDEENKHHRPEEISALILRKLKQDAEKSLGEEVTRAVITVPAYFGDLERNRTKQAGELAGFDVIGIINEPTAAAIAYGVEKGEQDSTFLVFDLGGGTFDVTVMQVQSTSDYKVLATAGNKYLGGVDFDDAICAYCGELFQKKYGIDPLEDPQVYQKLLEDAEGAKKELSADTEAEIYVSAAGHSLVVDLTRDTFEDLIRVDIDQAQHLTNKVLSDPPVNNAPIDKVLLVGGSTRIPQIQGIVKNLTGKEPATGFNPDEVVAIGAAIYAASLTNVPMVDPNMKPLPKIKVRDVTAHALGVTAYEGENDTLRNFIIIPQNSEVPVEIKYNEAFTTRYDNQEEVEFQVMEGESVNPDECMEVGKAALLTGIPRRPKGEPQIMVTLGYDRSGIVKLYAQELNSGREVKAEIQYSTALLSQEELKKAAAAVAKLKVK